MRASELIAVLQKLMAEGDPEVRAQSHGCCSHAHEIKKVESDAEYPGDIVIRV